MDIESNMTLWIAVIISLDDSHNRNQWWLMLTQLLLDNYQLSADPVYKRVPILVINIPANFLAMSSAGTFSADLTEILDMLTSKLIWWSVVLFRPLWISRVISRF